MPRDIHSSSSLRFHAMGMIVLLTLQYLFGEFTSLFVHFPEKAQSGQLWEFAWRQVPAAIHTIIGVLLSLGTLAFIVRAVMSQNKTWITSSLAAGVAVLGAAIAGIIFVPSQKDTFSFFMAVYFIFALFAYFWGLYQSK